MPRSVPPPRDLAESYLQRALVLDDAACIVWARICLAYGLAQEQQPSSAAGELTLALALAEREGDTETLAVCRWRLGVLWARIGDLGTTRYHLDEGLRVAREGDHRLMEGILLTNLAFTWGSEGQTELYRSLSEEALVHFEALGDRERAHHVRCNLASAIVRQGQLEEAEALYDRVAAELDLGQAPMLEGIILGGRSEAAFQRGDIATGRALSEASEATFEAGGLSYDALRQRVLRSAQLTKRGCAAEALRLAIEAMTRAQALGYRAVATDALHKQADAHAALGSYEDAYTTLLRVVEERTEADRVEVRQKYALLRDAQTAVAVARDRIRTEELARMNVRLREAIIDRDRLNQELERHASTDPLTGALNRRGWLRYIDGLAKADTDPHPWTLLLVDIDDFKSVNDRHGHSAGDAVLQDLATLLLSTLASQRGAVVRIGGDEFAVLLYDPDHRLAPSFATAWASPRTIPHPSTASPVPYTISVGTTDISAWTSLREALDRADATMYLSKRSKPHPS